MTSTKTTMKSLSPLVRSRRSTAKIRFIGASYAVIRRRYCRSANRKRTTVPAE